MRKAIVSIGFNLLLLLGCNKEKLPEVPLTEGVYIVNEGNYGYGNAEISFYNPAMQQVTNGLFQSANGYLLGDIAQSMYIQDSLGFIVVNHSAKVEVVSIPSFHKIRTISIPGSNPRYFLPVNDSLAYVSELYANRIYVVNYRTGAWLTSISMPQYTEHLLRLGDVVMAEGKRIYKNASSSGALMRIDALHHTLMDTIRLNGDAGGIAVDKNKQIWIALNTDTVSGIRSALLCYDNQFNEIQRYTFTEADFHPTNLCLDESGENLYFLSRSVYRYTISTGVLTELIPSSQNNFYGLSVDPLSGDIYVSDALDYVQPSRVYRYHNNGTLVHSFTAGVASGNFAFSYE